MPLQEGCLSTELSTGRLLAVGLSQLEKLTLLPRKSIMLAPFGTVIPFICQICQPSELQNVGIPYLLLTPALPMKVSHLPESCVQNFLAFIFFCVRINTVHSSVLLWIDIQIFPGLCFLNSWYDSHSYTYHGVTCALSRVHLSRVKVLDQRVGECWALLHNPKLFSEMIILIYISTSKAQEILSVHIFSVLSPSSAKNLALLDFLIFANHIDLVCLSRVLICISTLTNEVEHLCIYWPCIYLLFWNFCSYLLLIFQLGCKYFKLIHRNSDFSKD